MIVLAVLGVAVLGYVTLLLLARRARASFCTDGCVTMAVRLKPSSRPIGWKHGYARLTDDLIEWRSERRTKAGADMTFRRDTLHVTDHHPVRKGETMLSEATELVEALYQGEQIELGVLRTDLETFLGWPLA